MDAIDVRYPGLAPLYWTWHGVHDEAFEKQSCHLGSRADVFPDLRERVGWEVAGFLIASFLVLQDNVASVEYSPDNDKRYLLMKGRLDDVVKFLDDENDLLTTTSE